MTCEEFGKAYQDSGYQRTVRFLQKSGLSRDQAIEIAQAAWVKGWERISQLRDENVVVEWVITIARHLLFTSFRQCRLVDFSEINREPAVAPSFNPAAIDLWRALRDCKPRERIVIEAFLKGYSQCELAKLSGKSLPAVHAELSRARKTLRKRMGVASQVMPRPDVFRKKIQQEIGAQLLKVSGA